MSEILVASGNLHKIREMQAILAPHGIKLLSPQEAGGIPEVIEDGTSFAENAIKKALETARASGRTVLADDSGLEVEALHGEPGIYSARYAGEGGNDGRNVQKLLLKLQGCDMRRARFVCVIAVATAEGLIGTAEGEIKGQITRSPAGTGGFGYDPVFIPDGFQNTFAELPEECKNQLSHRARALQAALQQGLLM
ncbi:MAG: RdgB/HAM1 family non-canonical purine NTP pyrophosphatase [Lentisphaeria bacterium]|nr:RdgB/HAM1 family non-canonical purine NTP pyrophosphatase [Lentisphaeria bacterium]